MDPYTARCLQVSTNVAESIPMQRRRSTNMMRRQNSVAEARSSSLQPSHQRSRSAWPTPSGEMNSIQSYPVSTSGMASMQPSRFASPSLSTGSPFDTPFQMAPHMTPVTPFTPSEWNAGVTLDPKQVQGLGMDFPDPAFAVNPTDVHEDVIHMNANGMWDLSDSPGRRSSAAESDVTEMTDSNVPSAAVSTYEGMAGRDDRRSRSRSIHRTSRSLSRTPAERLAMKRSHRRQLSCQPIAHGRNMSVSTGPYLPTLPQTPAVLPDQVGQDGSLNMDFVNHDYMNAGLPDQDMGMETDFHNNFEDFMGVPMSVSQSAASHVDRLNSTPPTDMMFWDHNTYPVSDLMGSPSNHSEEHEHHDGCCGSVDDAEKPDLFESLRQEPSRPPEEDFHPEDPDMVPQEQEPRFEGDLYTPRWVRGQGNKREGYCGLCKPGRWLVLKNSAYWYDKSFTHGVSAQTGQPFEGPRETRRMAGNPDVWEGLCSGCNDWIALISSKKKGTTWFRHAYKCHGKNKDKKARQTTPPRQPSPYANMKPVPMTELPSQAQHHHHPDMMTMNPMIGMHGMGLHATDAGPFPEMTFLA